MKSHINTWEMHWMSSLPCSISQTRSPALKSTHEGAQKSWWRVGSARVNVHFDNYFSTNDLSPWNGGRGAKNIWVRQKGPVSKLKWNTAALQLCYLPYCKSSHKTEWNFQWSPLWFSGILSVPMGSEVINYLLSGFHFLTRIHITTHHWGKFPL